MVRWFLPYKDLLKAVLVDKTATTQLLTVLVESSENAGARAVLVMTFLAVLYCSSYVLASASTAAKA